MSKVKNEVSAKVHEIDGIKYREVSKVVEVGDKILIKYFNDVETNTIREVIELVKEYPGDIFFKPDFDGDSYLDTDCEVYSVVEPIADADVVEATANDANERILDMLGNLAVRLTELERNITAIQRNRDNVVGRVDALEESVEMALDDIVTLDERTQGLTEPVDSSEIDDLLSDINGTNIDLLLNDVAYRLTDRIYTDFLRAGGR